MSGGARGCGSLRGRFPTRAEREQSEGEVDGVCGSGSEGERTSQPGRGGDEGEGDRCEYTVIETELAVMYEVRARSGGREGLEEIAGDGSVRGGEDQVTGERVVAGDGEGGRWHRTKRRMRLGCRTWIMVC